MYLAVDVGGTKTLLASFDKKGVLKHKTKFPTPKTYAEFLEEFGFQIKKLPEAKFVAAGAALPGLIDRKHGVVISFGNLDWKLIPIRDDFERLLGCPVEIENDSKLAGLSEARLIKKEFKKVLYVTISTGIGGGMIIDGVIDQRYIDAEVGHMLLEHQGKLQIWEDFASGRAIKAKFGKLAKDITDPKDWYIISRNIAIGLIDLVATYTPEVIIIGGGVGSHFDKFGDRLIEDMKIYENPLVKIPPIRPASRAEEAVIYGCFELVKDKYGSAT